MVCAEVAGATLGLSLCPTTFLAHRAHYVRHSEEPEMSHERTTTPTSSGYNGWVGWIAFAAAIMVLLGSLHIFQGLVALFRDEVFIASDASRQHRLHRLGRRPHPRWASSWLPPSAFWPARSGRARSACCFALGSALANVAFIGAYPFWSLIMVALDIVIILALTVHGSEIKPA